MPSRADRPPRRGAAFFLSVLILAPGPLFSLGKDSLSFSITRKPRHLQSNFYDPYAVWWVEDENQKLVKILYMTFYKDGNQGNQERCGKTGFLFALTFFRSRFGDAGCPNQPGEQCGNCPTCPPRGAFALADGITGCSEPSGHGSTEDVTVTRYWDLTDRRGDRVPAGVYSLNYNAVFADEDIKETDKAFQMKVKISHEAFDTTVLSPSEISGSQSNPLLNDREFVLTAMRTAYGGKTGGSGSGPGSAGAFHNVPPDPSAETVDTPRGECGSGILAVFPVILVQRWFRRRKSKHRNS